MEIHNMVFFLCKYEKKKHYKTTKKISFVQCMNLDNTTWIYSDDFFNHYNANFCNYGDNKGSVLLLKKLYLEGICLIKDADLVSRLLFANSYSEKKMFFYKKRYSNPSMQKKLVASYLNICEVDALLKVFNTEFKHIKSILDSLLSGGRVIKSENDTAFNNAILLFEYNNDRSDYFKFTSYIDDLNALKNI